MRKMNKNAKYKSTTTTLTNDLTAVVLNKEACGRNFVPS